MPHKPTYYSLNQLPVNYNNDATFQNWGTALEQWLPNKEVRNYIQEFIGYCLIPYAQFDKAVVLLGGGANGKSTFLEVIQELFGGNNLTNISLHRLSQRFEVANLESKLINICPDIDPTYLSETGIIKALISGEKVRGEHKFKKSYDFTSFVKLIFSANEMPRARDKTEGWYRRIDIVEFPNTFVIGKQGFDPDLSKKLTSEIEGIFIWALRGLQRLMERGYFKEPTEIRNEKLRYATENNPILVFIQERTITCDEPRDYETQENLYGHYMEYCKDLRIRPASQNMFTRELKKIGYDVSTKSISGGIKKKCYKGLKYYIG